MSKSIGIIGFGNFGAFVHGKLSAFPEHTLSVYDPGHPQESSSLEDVVASDIVVLAIPLSSYQDMLPKISRLVSSQTVIVDVCSVKVKPEQLLSKHMPSHTNILLTHPLFGPQSAPDSLKDHTLIVCSEAKTPELQSVLNFCSQTLGLKLYHYSADEHDKIMADVHALTFFVAKGLASIKITEPPFMTPSYNMILDLQNFSQKNSDELFMTIESGNPYAQEVRTKILDSFTSINDSINKAASQKS